MDFQISIQIRPQALPVLVRFLSGVLLHFFAQVQQTVDHRNELRTGNGFAKFGRIAVQLLSILVQSIVQLVAGCK